MLLPVLVLLLVSRSLLPPVDASVETLLFENGCLKQADRVQLTLRCSLFEHIEILRVIYGYSKTSPSLDQCQFSIYDCIQEGASRNILSCNGKQTCIIQLTKNEILSTTVTTHGVPSCPDFNYVQVNFGCMPDAKDICDSWKEEGAIIHLSHTRSRDELFDQCQCKVRSSLAHGQVLLHAREINRDSANGNDPLPKKAANVDCKKTTFLEIATDRSERKCMDNLPAHGNALFGSGSHNFTLNYVRNDPTAALFFYFELKASPETKDHHVQISCNWARRTTTMATRRITVPKRRAQRSTTIDVMQGAQLSRLDLMRQQKPVPDETDDGDEVDAEETSTAVVESQEEDEERPASRRQRKKNFKRKVNVSEALVDESASLPFASIDPDEEWSRIAEVDSLPASQQSLSLNNRTYLGSMHASVQPVDGKSRRRLSKDRVLSIFLLTACLTIVAFILYCLVIKRPVFLQRLQFNFKLALLFCCEASKVIFSSPSTHTHSLSSLHTETLANQHSSLPLSIEDYQSSEYYINAPTQPTHIIQDLYDPSSLDERRSMSSSDNDDRHDVFASVSRYDQGDTC